jgi:16S rRNA (guanine(966)-N(2))-methyltransferase RsmD
LFDILAARVPGSVFVDAYAGSGSVGIEALSRGAARVVFIEAKRTAAAMIRENLRSLGAGDRGEIHCARASQVLEFTGGEIVFLDPPYELAREYVISLEALGRLSPPLVVAQHSSCHSLEEQYGPLARTRVVRQGDNSLSFYEPER